VLSRIAESLFWMGRYTERAGSTARILDVYSTSLLEARTGEVDTACGHLLEALGVSDHAAEIHADIGELIAFVVDDPRYAGSIVRSVSAAWDNARGVREVISSEMWESLNVTHATLTRRRASSAFARHALLPWVRERAAILAGLADTTMSHDDAWRFFVLGATLERVDMTVRLISTRLGDAWGNDGWVAMLRCCSAHESFLRTYRRGVDGRLALEFLLLDRLFPRSVLAAMRVADGLLVEIDPISSRNGTVNAARRFIGSACATLEFVQIDEVEVALGEHLVRLEQTITRTHDAIANQFFHAATAIRWSA
jgi:uncharacterized alpha-E superfamily protein